MNITSKETERFFKKFELLKSDQCWLWKGCIDNGYGRMLIGTKSILAHHIAFFVFNQKLPSRYVMHSCENKHCVNPAHLYESDRQTNES